MNVLGKKLLILGGTKLSCEIIKQAKQQGAIVYVTDYLEDSPGKRIADQSFMVSATDVNAVVHLIKEEKIDGVLTGFIDSLLPYYQSICEKSGLPCYATADQFEIATDKMRFKALCEAFDVPVVESYSLSYPLKQSETQVLNYPVLIKPADNSGARGIYVCEDEKSLIDRYEDAMTFSKSKKILVERYMDEKEATIFYVIQEGHIYLSGMADRHMKNKKRGYIRLPVAYTWPSQALIEYEKTLHPKVVKMFESIGLKNGIVFIQSFVVDGTCVFYEMGYRLSGSLEYKIMKQLNGLNPLEMLVNFALTGKMEDRSLDGMFKPNYDQWGFSLTFLAKPGKIGTLEGVDAVAKLDGVLDVVPAYSSGETVPVTAVGTLKQVLLRVLATAKTKCEMKTLMDRIHEAIRVRSEEGDDMLLDVFDTNELGICQTILISGAGGYLAGELIQTLIKDTGIVIYALTSNKEKLKRQFKTSDQVIVVSVDELVNTWHKIDTLIHCAFSRSFSSPEEIENSLEFTNVLFKLAHEHKIPNIINISSQAVYGKSNKPLWHEKMKVAPESIYGKAKYVSELAALNIKRMSGQKTKVTNLRIASITGGSELLRLELVSKFVISAINHESIHILGGEQVLSYIDLRDVCAGIKALLSTPPNTWKEVYNLGANEQHNILEIADLVIRVSEKFGYEPVDVEIDHRDIPLNVGMDSDLFFHDTGWSPKYTLEDTIGSLFEFFMENTQELKRNQVKL